MRWKCVAWLVTILSAASAQEVSIDNDLHIVDTITRTTTQKTTSTEYTTVDQDNHQREHPVNIQDDNNNSEEDQDNTIESSENTEEETGENVATTTTFISISDEDKDESVESTTTTTTISDEDKDETVESKTTTTTISGEDKDETVENSYEDGQESTETEVSKSSEDLAQSSEDAPSVEVEGGAVQGHYLHGDLGIRSYIDIPYGSFRRLFQAPTKADKWETVRDITEHQSRCPQIDESGDYAGEIDCLTLSVFAPSHVENAAVLFHIYDGDFKLGSANPLYYGPEYLVSKGVILVIPNYRVGVLGFLCLNNNIAPGNAGLKDLTLALEWTANNIAQFGGNSSNIFVSGDGASGALAGYLALSPVSRPYISGVITESGSMLSHWAIDRDPSTTASLLTQAVKENIDNEINAEIVVNAGKDIEFRPCVETGVDAFLNATPWEILLNKEDKIEMPFIIGSASHAGLQEAMTHTSESLSELHGNFSIFLPNDLEFVNEEKITVAEKIKKLYFEDKDIALENIEQLSLCYTDAYYLGPSIRASRALLKAGAKVYFYEFSFVGELNRMQQSLSSTVHGAARGDLSSYIFTQDGEFPEKDSIEESKVELITDLWVSFLQNGIPTSSDDSVKWDNMEQVAESEEQWLSIGQEVRQNKGLHEDRLALWTEIYNEHFIERNMAITLRSSLFLIATRIILFGFGK